MTEPKLFKYLWRFNALVFAAAGVLAIIVLTFAAYTIAKETFGKRHRNEIVNVDPDTNIKEVLRLGHLNRIVGSKVVLLPLYSDQDFSLKYSGSKATVSTRNILFMDIRSSQSHWLLPHNQFLIFRYGLINKDNSYDSDKKIVTIIYQIVKSDTNNDARLTENDLITLAFTDPAGNNFTEVLSDLEAVLGYELIGDGKIAIVFNQQGSGYTAYVDLDTFSVTEQVALPKFDGS